MTLAIQQTEKSRIRSPYAKLFGTGELTRGTHCSVIVAHPGDEIVGAGCLISKLVDVSVLHVTDGITIDNDCSPTPSEKRKASAKLLNRECLKALTIANVPRQNVFDLFVPDRCAAQYLVSITRRIISFLQQSEADIVITHPYEGAHPDHDATAFATHNALRLMTESGLRPPVIFEMGLHPGSDLETRVCEFLPGSEGEVTTLVLDERSHKLKERMFACLDALNGSISSAPIDSEKFRRPPNYDFSEPPNSNKLHYEVFPWSIESATFQTLASSALHELSSTKRSLRSPETATAHRSNFARRANAR